MFGPIIEELELSREDTPEESAEVVAILARPGLEDETLDDTARAYVTIDNPGSRDLDQALHVAPDGAGWVLRYALADASYYVRPGSALWQRALARGASYYFPGMALPMLPEALSEGLVSLNPGVLRRALCFETRVSREGEALETVVRRVRLRSRGKLSYEGVQAWFDGVASEERDKVSAAVEACAGVRDGLEAFAALGEALLGAQRRRGVITLERHEAHVTRSDADPSRLVATLRRRGDVERWNEQVSLLCNIEGARMLRAFGRGDEDVQAVYRVHLPPLRERLSQLRETLDALVARRALGEGWRWRGADVAEYLDALPRAAHLRRLRAAVQRQVRYTFRASEFRARSGPHHALGVDGYSRMSSPMREVVGVFSHKELLEGLGLETAPDPSGDERLREAVITAANASKKRQRAIDKEVDLLLIRQLFGDDVRRAPAARPWHLGTVVGVRATRLYVALDGLAVDVKVYVEDLAQRHGAAFRAHGGVLLEGPVSFALGDAVELRALAWDTGRRRFVLDARPSAG